MSIENTPVVNGRCSGASGGAALACGGAGFVPDRGALAPCRVGCGAGPAGFAPPRPPCLPRLRPPRLLLPRLPAPGGRLPCWGRLVLGEVYAMFEHCPRVRRWVRRRGY